MRLKLLIIDDETKILTNLSTVLPWDEMGIDVVGLARNGMEGMEAVRAHRPDLVLCDIRMPIMDGIQFLEALAGFGSGTDREEKADAEVVMLTGYQDFEYARSVIRYGVRDYILKPIDYDELMTVIERLAGSIRARRRAKRQEEDRYGQAAAIAYEKRLYDRLLGYSAPLPHATLHGDGRKEEAVCYTMLLADFDDYAERFMSNAEQERRLWNFAVRNVLEEMLAAEELRHAVLQTRDGELCILVEAAGADHGVAAADCASDGMRLARLLQQSAADHTKISLSIGVYPTRIAPNQLHAAFKTLQRRMQLDMGKRASCFVCGSDEGGDMSRVELWEPIEALVSAMRQHDRDAVERALSDLTAHMHAVAGQSLARAAKLGHFLVLHLLRGMRELGALTSEQEQDIWAMTEQADRVKDVLAVVRRIIGTCQDNAASARPGNVLMHAAKDYIHRHLPKDLGIDEVAESIGISSSYFSMLFKQHFGSTFVEYVTAQRIELAKSMLLLTSRSIADIGRSVGYAERRYFTKVFQKLTGVIPSEYRERRNARDTGEAGEG
jgi:two-component system, response regulator YesN